MAVPTEKFRLVLRIGKNQFESAETLEEVVLKLFLTTESKALIRKDDIEARTHVAP